MIVIRLISNNMFFMVVEMVGRLSDKVKELDLEKSWVEDILRVVE